MYGGYKIIRPPAGIRYSASGEVLGCGEVAFLMILVFYASSALGSGSLHFALTRRKKRDAGLRFGHRHRAQKRMLELWLIQGAK